MPAGYGKMQRGGGGIWSAQIESNLENHMYHKYSQVKPASENPILRHFDTVASKQPYTYLSHPHRRDRFRARSIYRPPPLHTPRKFLSVREPSRICFFSLPFSASPLVFPSFPAIISSLDLVLAKKIPCCCCWRMGLAELMGIEGGGF